MHDLLLRVDAGVGPPGSVDVNGFSRNRRNRGSDYRLDAAAVALRLPTDEIRPVVF